MSSAPAIEMPILRRNRGAELSACCALFWLTIRQHLHGKRLLVLILLYLLPCILAVVLRMIPRPAPAYMLEFGLALNMLPHALCPLTALLYAGGIIRDEVEEQTLTYLLLRSTIPFLLSSSTALLNISRTFGFTLYPRLKSKRNILPFTIS